MNILIVDSSIAFTGAFNCAVTEAELLSGNHEFSFVLPQQSNLRPYLEQKGFKVHMLPMVEIRKSLTSMVTYLPALYKNARLLKKIVQQEQIDVVQMNDFYNLLGMMLKRMGYTGKLITYVRFLPMSRPAPLRKLWTTYAQRYSDKVITVSKVAMSQLPPHPNTSFIYDPINLQEKLSPKEYTPGPTVNILFQGNYIRGKGQDAGLEAFAIAYRSNPAIRLTFSGGDMGLEKNREYKEQLQNRVKELGLEQVVTFTAFAPSVEQGVKNADIVLNFSESESFSMTCLEASFFGTALIATRCGGPEEIIVDGETGFLVPLHDYPAAAEAILKLAGDAGLRKSFATAARQRVMREFPAEKFVVEFEKILAELN